MKSASSWLFPRMSAHVQAWKEEYFGGNCSPWIEYLFRWEIKGRRAQWLLSYWPPPPFQHLQLCSLLVPVIGIKIILPWIHEDCLLL